MQTTGVHLKKLVWQPMGTPVNDKGGADLTVIGHSIILDEILEANCVRNCLLGEPDLILVAWDSAFLGDSAPPHYWS
jgi:hypothetical protein